MLGLMLGGVPAAAAAELPLLALPSVSALSVLLIAAMAMKYHDVAVDDV